MAVKLRINNVIGKTSHCELNFATRVRLQRGCIKCSLITNKTKNSVSLKYIKLAVMIAGLVNRVCPSERNLLQINGAKNGIDKFKQEQYKTKC